MFETQDMYRESDETPTWQSGVISLEVVIVDQDESRPPEQGAIDTAVVLAPDDRDAAPVLPTGDEGIKKPPTDPPETTLATPDDFPDEGDEQEQRARLYADLHPGLELVGHDGYDLVINRGHSDQELVEEAVTRLTDGSTWHESEQDQFEERTYHVDDPEVPTLFAKTTNYAVDPYRDLSDNANKMVISQDVKAVVDSEQAQQAVREQSFGGITFVEPLATAISMELDSAVTVYPWQHGALTPLADTWELEVPEVVARDELARVNAVAQDLHALLGANGIEAPDLGSTQILIDENKNLALIDVEEYRKFQTPEPALAPAESAYFKGGQWHAGDDPAYANEDAPEMATIEQSAVGIARGAEDPNASSPEFYAEWQGNGVVVTLWNAVTRETAVIHTAGTAGLQFSVSQALGRIPNAARKGTIMHVLGDNIGLLLDKQLEGVTVRRAIPLEGTSDIYLNTSTGRIEVYDETGAQSYIYQPPSTREA